MRHLAMLSLPTIAASLILAACGSSTTHKASSSPAGGGQAMHTTSGSSAVVKSASNPALGTILVNGQGMTLYQLSAERNGRFICANPTCLHVWHPLTVSAGSTPSGEVGSLGTVRRPDGSTQVTYNGLPLYTFARDEKPGDTKGQGFKDVGTWSAARIGSSPPKTSTQTPSSSGGYGC